MSGGSGQYRPELALAVAADSAARAVRQRDQAGPTVVPCQSIDMVDVDNGGSMDPNEILRIQLVLEPR